MAESYRRRSVDATCAGDWELAADLGDKCTLYLQNVQILVDRSMADGRRQRINKWPDEKPNFGTSTTHKDGAYTARYESKRNRNPAEAHDLAYEVEAYGDSESALASEWDVEALRQWQRSN